MRTPRCVASAAVLVFLLCLPARAASPEDHPAVPEILSRAESFFHAMKARDYPAVFAALSAKSRESIVLETNTALAGTKGGAPGHDAVRDDFAGGGPIARDYWDAFLRRFDPDAALEHSRWEIGFVGKDRAEILLTHRGAERPAALKMFREVDGWKTGLVETFRSR